METETHWLVQRNYEAPRYIKICPVEWQDHRDQEWMRENDLTIRSSQDPHIGGSINTVVTTWEEAQHKTNFRKDDIGRPFCTYCNELATHRVKGTDCMVDVCKTHAKYLRDCGYEVHTQMDLYREWAKAEASYHRIHSPSRTEALENFYKEWNGYLGSKCYCMMQRTCTMHPNTSRHWWKEYEANQAKIDETHNNLSHNLMEDPRYIKNFPFIEASCDESMYRDVYIDTRSRVERMGEHFNIEDYSQEEQDNINQLIKSGY